MRLVVFDVDGTLVDSQADIVASMAAAFGAVEMPAPTRQDILGIVGLSLPVAMRTLAPEADHDRMVAVYKDSYADLRLSKGAASSPLYPGARAALDRLNGRDDILLGIATGKSKRGLDGLIEIHGLEGMFVTRQVADFHPSKPHPSMLQAAMDEAGVYAADAVMIGDTSFDADMAEAARMPFIGVSWGYHPASRLNGARAVLNSFDDLDDALGALWVE
ncbi:HAD-IA family hydrolase [Tateyamaria sp. ANG-S1]|uniref:HAD-IA family hydrolase n=1 Tax=Tateyamaria sp. ANG-S1 TaxID=1577905 RepID=UPI00057D2CF7|nr:HAD-IA family hydrolase [Tateyamaria sp. ANG-S1]KIC48090.1 HAD family hydrolase [Tateyamaria sp. ANG-S1]